MVMVLENMVGAIIGKAGANAKVNPARGVGVVWTWRGRGRGMAWRGST